MSTQPWMTDVEREKFYHSLFALLQEKNPDGVPMTLITSAYSITRHRAARLINRAERRDWIEVKIKANGKKKETWVYYKKTPTNAEISTMSVSFHLGDDGLFQCMGCGIKDVYNRTGEMDRNNSEIVLNSKGERWRYNRCPSCFEVWNKKRQKKQKNKKQCRYCGGRLPLGRYFHCLSCIPTGMSTDYFDAYGVTG